MKKKSKGCGLGVFTFIILLLAGGVWLYRYKQKTLDYAMVTLNPGGLEQVLINYGESIDKAAAEFNLNPAYLKALCMLECSGRKVVKPRFESHIYQRLKQVKNGSLDKYEHVTPLMLADASDAALQNLASSWGPFQLMGYKCLLLSIKIADIRGENAVYWGVKWINETYGNAIRKGNFKDAFHLHNTGKPYPLFGKPKTYHPDYVENGLKYMDYFIQNPHYISSQ